MCGTEKDGRFCSMCVVLSFKMVVVLLGERFVIFVEVKRMGGFVVCAELKRICLDMCEFWW